jgi:hypothetical protein
MIMPCTSKVLEVDVLPSAATVMASPEPAAVMVTSPVQTPAVNSVVDAGEMVPVRSERVAIPEKEVTVLP